MIHWAFRKFPFPWAWCHPPRVPHRREGMALARLGCVKHEDLAGGIISAEILPLTLGFVIVLAINFIKWSLLFSYYGTS